MMTPVDIETADFKKVALGYSCDEVDTFLDKVIVEFERLFKENAKLQDKVTTTEEALKYYKDLEDTIRNSIVRAEKQLRKQSTMLKLRQVRLLRLQNSRLLILCRMLINNFTS